MTYQNKVVHHAVYGLTPPVHWHDRVNSEVSVTLTASEEEFILLKAMEDDTLEEIITNASKAFNGQKIFFVDPNAGDHGGAPDELKSLNTARFSFDSLYQKYGAPQNDS